MEQIMKEIETYFIDENKEEAVLYIMNKLRTKEIDVLDLYTNILTPLLTDMTCKLEDKRICIWKEHVRTGIARTIVESCYPFILEKRDSLKLPYRGVAAVLCPSDEYHDMGARMVADFLTVVGYHTIFAGCNTPYRDFHNAIHIIKPDLVAISVSDYYNLVAAKKMIDEIKKTVSKSIKIVVGGHAFYYDEANKLKMVGADCYANTYDDILKIAEDGVIL